MAWCEGTVNWVRGSTPKASRERGHGPEPLLAAVVIQLAAEVAQDLVMVGLFGDGLFNGRFHFGDGKVFEAGLELVPGSQRQFGCELSRLGVVVGVQTVDGPELDQKLFLMALRAMPPPPDKVHWDDVL